MAITVIFDGHGRADVLDHFSVHRATPFRDVGRHKVKDAMAEDFVHSLVETRGSDFIRFEDDPLRIDQNDAFAGRRKYRRFGLFTRPQSSFGLTQIRDIDDNADKQWLSVDFNMCAGEECLDFPSIAGAQGRFYVFGRTLLKTIEDEISLRGFDPDAEFSGGLANRLSWRVSEGIHPLNH